MSNAPKFAPGDRVTMTNDYGVEFPGKRIVSLDDSLHWSNPEPRYFIEPTDTPWFSVAEGNLSPAPG